MKGRCGKGMPEGVGEVPKEAQWERSYNERQLCPGNTAP